MKRIITVAAVLAMVSSLIVPVRADEKMTADKVKEMLYASLCKIRGNFEQAAKKISEPSDEKHREK